MSCRVLKRDMECAMMDEFVDQCTKKGVKRIRGYYYPTQKNGIVNSFYGLFGFGMVSEDEEGNSVWELNVSGYDKTNVVMEVNR